jgi:hypothetical protein
LALREGDLVSNEEQCRLLYGDGVLGVDNQRPLFLYAGKLRRLVVGADRVARLAASAASDADFVRLATRGDAAAVEAAAEAWAALPHILVCVCQSHSAVGADDGRVAATVHALFELRAERAEGLRDAVLQALGGGEDAEAASRARAAALELCGLAARLVVEFEREGASTRLRRAPLLALTRALLVRLHDLRCAPGEAIGAAPAPRAAKPKAGAAARLWRLLAGGEGGAADEAPAPAAPAAAAAKVAGEGRGSSFAAPQLDSFAAAAAAAAAAEASGGGDAVEEEGEEEEEAEGESKAGEAAAVVDVSRSATAARAGRSRGGADTRTIRGLVALLSRPNEGTGRLDGGTGAAGGDADFDASERLEALRECARRIFYLLTMVHANGNLRVPEAERRLVFFINSLYMPAMPASASVLQMPSLTVVTPHYSKCPNTDDAS